MITASDVLFMNISSALLGRRPNIDGLGIFQRIGNSSGDFLKKIIQNSSPFMRNKSGRLFGD